MSTTVLETGAILVLEDRFTTTLDKLVAGLETAAERTKALQAQFGTLGLGGTITKMEGEWKELLGLTDRGVAGIAARFDSLGEKAMPGFAKMVAGADSAFEKVVRGAGAMESSVVAEFGTAGGEAAKAMSRSLTAASTGMFSSVVAASKVAGTEAAANLAAATAAMDGVNGRLRAAGGAEAVAQASGGVGRTAHRTGGPHFGRVGTEIPGGHVSVAGTPALGAAGVVAYGAFEAAEMRDEVNRLLITGQVDAEKWGATREQLSKLLMDSASLTTYSVKEVGEALSKSERAMSGLDVQTKMDVTKTLLPYAAAEARLKETSLAESLESMVGLAHMTGTYEPAAIADLARKFSYVSLSTNASLPRFENTLSYSMPLLRSQMGMDPDTIMALTAVAQNAGITSTKSGTWLRSFFEGSEPAMGDSKAAQKHNGALYDMGLIDNRLNVTWKKFGADGKVDWNASVANEADIIAKHLAKLPVDQRAGTVKEIWGERGGGMASMLSMTTFVEQFATLAAKIQQFQGGASAIEELAKDNPLMKGREAWRDFQNVLIDIGNTTLPAVNVALTSLDTALKRLPADWDATTKMWSDRVEAVERLFLGGPLAGQAPETAVEKAWKLQHPGQPVPADLIPKAGISPMQARRIPHPDGIREGTDRGVHYMNSEARFELQKQMGLLPAWATREAFGPQIPPNLIANDHTSAAAARAVQDLTEDRATRAGVGDQSWWHKIFGAASDPARDAGQKLGVLSDKTGIVLTSFDSLNGRSTALSADFTGLGTGSGTLANDFKILEATALGAARALAEVAMSGGGAGGGFMNASWGGGSPDLSGAFRGGGEGVGHTFSAAEREANIRHYAGSIGINPDVAMAVARSEGFGKFTGDNNTSFGDLQMHVNGGLGDAYRRATGKNPADPHNELELDRFALDEAKKGGWGPWHGAARIHVHGRYGMDWHGSVPTAGPPPRSKTVAPGRPAATAEHVEASIGRALANAHLNVNVAFNDRAQKHVAKFVLKQAGHMGGFPTSMGGTDNHSHYTSPGTPIRDSA